MVGDSWNVYWNEYASDTYLYGSKIQFHQKDDIEFENHLMPPGTVIKQWTSKTNYQRDRIEPSLPLIDGEGRYRIAAAVDTLEGEHIMLRIVFYDRYENEVGNIALWDKETYFKCPITTYSYSIQLLNAGVTRFHFHSIGIWEVTDEEETEVKRKKTKKTK